MTNESTILHNVSEEKLREIVREEVQDALKISPKDEPDIFMDREQAAEMLHISLSTLHKHTRGGAIPWTRLGKRVLYRKADVEKALKMINEKKIE